MLTETPAAPTPSTPLASPAPSAPSTPQLTEYEAHKVARGYSEAPKRPAEPAPAPETPSAPVHDPATAAPETPVHPLAAAPEPAEGADEPETPPGPQPTGQHRWKDPDSGVTLDLRRRDHRRIKKLLEERSLTAQENSELRRRLTTLPQQTAQQPQAVQRAMPAQAGAIDPGDPEPQLEQFADQPDPYGAHIEARAVWAARQEFKRQEADRGRVERGRQQEAQVNAAQQAWDAKLPTIRQTFPNFDAAYEELHDSLARVGKASRPLVQYLLTASDIGHEVAYFLGNHPDEVQRLFTAPTLDAHLRAIGALEARVRSSLTAAPAQASTTRAPAPTTPVHTGAPASPRTPDQIAQSGDYQAYRALRGMPATSAR